MKTHIFLPVGVAVVQAWRFTDLPVPRRAAGRAEINSGQARRGSHKRPDPSRETAGRDLPRRTGLGRIMAN
jgi:hypothetical protein